MKGSLTEYNAVLFSLQINYNNGKYEHLKFTDTILALNQDTKNKVHTCEWGGMKSDGRKQQLLRGNKISSFPLHLPHFTIFASRVSCVFRWRFRSSDAVCPTRACTTWLWPVIQVERLASTPPHLWCKVSFSSTFYKVKNISIKRRSGKELLAASKLKPKCMGDQSFENSFWGKDNELKFVCFSVMWDALCCFLYKKAWFEMQPNSFSVRLLLPEAPSEVTISRNPEGDLTEGDDVDLTCSVTNAYPTPNITWTRNGDVIKPNAEQTHKVRCSCALPGMITFLLSVLGHCQLFNVRSKNRELVFIWLCHFVKFVNYKLSVF